jgi:hypothetical protein
LTPPPPSIPACSLAWRQQTRLTSPSPFSSFLPETVAKPGLSLLHAVESEGIYVAGPSTGQHAAAGARRFLASSLLLRGNRRALCAADTEVAKGVPGFSHCRINNGSPACLFQGAATRTFFYRTLLDTILWSAEAVLSGYGLSGPCEFSGNGLSGRCELSACGLAGLWNSGQSLGKPPHVVHTRVAVLVMFFNFNLY